MKAVMVVLFIGVLGALFSAGVFMLRKPARPGDGNRRMARALALRVALSVALFVVILLGWHFGWLRPNGVPLG